MADKLNSVGLQYLINRLKVLFAKQADLDTLDAKVDDIIAEGGEPNKIDTISVNNTQQAITNKNVDITVPTKTSDITNDSDFQTETEVQALIDAAVAGITEIDFQVVTELPATGVKGVIYLVPKTGTAQDVYNEYIWVTPTGGTAHFEPLGTTSVDLSGYWSKAELVDITTAEIDAMFE